MSVNPLKDDPELKKFLQKLRSLEAAGFPGWRASFIARYESFLLDESETKRATKKYRQLSKSAKGLVSIILKVKDLLDQGHIKESKSSVKARQAMSELSRQINVVIDELETLLPITGQKEQEIGYSKLTLGAVLLRDNFSEYRRLSMCSESLRRLRSPIQKAGQLGKLDQFGVKLQTFCGIISDLGLNSTLTKCSEMARIVGEEEEAVELSLLKDKHQNIMPGPKEAADDESTMGETVSTSTESSSECGPGEAKRGGPKAKQDCQRTEPSKPASLKDSEAKLKNYMVNSTRPSSVRGTSFNEDDVEMPLSTEVPQHDEAQLGRDRRSQQYVRPSSLRGMSFSDDDEDSHPPSSPYPMPGSLRPNSVEDKPFNNQVLRPSALRGMSFDDDDDSQGNPVEPSRKSHQPIRPMIVRGLSFDDEADQIKEQQPNTHQLGRPFTFRGMSFGDDNDDVNNKGTSVEKSVEAPRSPSGLQGGLGHPPLSANTTARPATVRGLSFDDVESNKPPGSLHRGDESSKIDTSPNQGITFVATPLPNYGSDSKKLTKADEKLKPNGTRKGVDPDASTIGSAPEKKVTKKQASVEVELTNEKGLICSMWYARLAQPTREQMKKKVAALPESCGITVEDVEKLPWVRGGANLNVARMNELFLKR